MCQPFHAPHNVYQMSKDTSRFITKYITGSENWSDFFHPLSGFLESKNSTLFIRLFAFGLKNSNNMIKICLKHPIQGSIILIHKWFILDSFTHIILINLFIYDVFINFWLLYLIKLYHCHNCYVMDKLNCILWWQ